MRDIIRWTLAIYNYNYNKTLWQAFRLSGLQNQNDHDYIITSYHCESFICSTGLRIRYRPTVLATM